MSVDKSRVTKQLKARGGRYGQIPNELWEADDVSLRAKSVWVYLMCQGKAWDSSIANIARNLKMSRTKATESVEELRSKCMISTTKTTRGTDFIIHEPSAWAVQWRPKAPISRAVAVHPTDKAQSSDWSRFAHFMGGIQEGNTTNTIQDGMVGREKDFVSQELEAIFTVDDLNAL